MSELNASLPPVSPYRGTLETEVHWFQVALERQLPLEAAEIVLDWLDAASAYRRVGIQRGLSALEHAVRSLGESVRPFLDIYARVSADPSERAALSHWLASMPTSDGPLGRWAAMDEDAIRAVYEARAQDRAATHYRAQGEEALRQLLGEMLNHGVVGGLLPVTANLSLLAREFFFRILLHKQLPGGSETLPEHPLRQRLGALFPLAASTDPKTRSADPRWIQKIVYTFYRLVQFWLMRPLMRDDFLLVCHAESIDISREELAWLTRARVLKPLVPYGSAQVYHVVQVFALSAIWSEYRLKRYGATADVADKLQAAVESVWEQLALLTPERNRLNGNAWLALTQGARERRPDPAQAPSQRLSVEGLANLASAYLYMIGVRPFAAKGRPRLAPDDPVMVVLAEMAERYYQERRTFKGFLPFLRKGTLDDPDVKRVLAFFRTQAPVFMAALTDTAAFYQAWQQKFGGEWAFERALDDVRSMIESLPDEEQDPGAMFVFERMASQQGVPLSREGSPGGRLSLDVLQYSASLTDGPARSVGCWDTRSWIWWIVPRWYFKSSVGRKLLSQASIAFMRVDATGVFTWPANPPAST